VQCEENNNNGEGKEKNIYGPLEAIPSMSEVRGEKRNFQGVADCDIFEFQSSRSGRGGKLWAKRNAPVKNTISKEKN